MRPESAYPRTSWELRVPGSFNDRAGAATSLYQRLMGPPEAPRVRLLAAESQTPPGQKVLVSTEQ